ncbi:cytochrome b6-f complex subunit PetN [Photobacterium sp. 1_MG-2023]
MSFRWVAYLACFTWNICLKAWGCSAL